MKERGQEFVLYVITGLVIVTLIISGVCLALTAGYRGPSSDEIADAVAERIGKPKAEKAKYIPGTGAFKAGDLDPLTGTSAPVGKGQQKGVRLADRHIEEAGGIYGHPLKVFYRDSGSMPTPAVDAATKLVEVEGVPAFVGSFSSGVNKAIIESVSDPREVVHIGQGTTSPMLPVIDEKGFFFRACVNDLYQGAALAELMYSDGARTACILYLNNPYGVGLYKAVTIRFERLGGEILKCVKFDIGKTSYSSQIDAAIAPEPDAVLFITYPEDAVTQFKYVYERGYTKPVFYGTDSWRSPDIPAAVGWEKMDGVKGTSGGVPYGKAGTIFRKEHKKAYGHGIRVSFVGPGYDALMTIALSIAKAGKRPADLTGTDIRDQMVDISSPPGTKIYPGADEFKKALKLISEGKDIDYVGASGPVDYDPVSHDAASSVEIWKISAKEKAFVTSDVIIPKPVPREDMGPEYIIK